LATLPALASKQLWIFFKKKIKLIAIVPEDCSQKGKNYYIDCAEEAFTTPMVQT
jgi:hypothetical protein